MGGGDNFAIAVWALTARKLVEKHAVRLGFVDYKKLL